MHNLFNSFHCFFERCIGLADWKGHGSLVVYQRIVFICFDLLHIISSFIDFQNHYSTTFLPSNMAT